MPKAEVEKIAAAKARRVDDMSKSIQKGLIGWNGKTVWSRLDGSMPHAIPADPALGLEQDLLMYENAVIFAGPPNGQAQGKVAFLQVPEMVKVAGDVWKFVELPHC